MKKRLNVWLSLLGTVACIISVAGCAESPNMAAARHQRDRAMVRGGRLVASVENHRTQNLTRTIGVLRQRDQYDAKSTRGNAEILKGVPAEEMNRWTKKQDAYRTSIHHHLEGDPAAIEKTVPMIVY